MEGHKYQFFHKNDDNDTFENHCMSVVCKQNHMIRKKEMKLGMYTCDMPYISLFEVLMCQLRERERQCNFCKLCFDCRPFKILCHDWGGIIRNSNRKYRTYCTAVRFCQRNLKYPKTQCMTVDFLNSGVVDEDFFNFVEKNERIFFETGDKFRRAKVW